MKKSTASPETASPVTGSKTTVEGSTDTGTKLPGVKTKSEPFVCHVPVGEKKPSSPKPEKTVPFVPAPSEISTLVNVNSTAVEKVKLTVSAAWPNCKSPSA